MRKIIIIIALLLFCGITFAQQGTYVPLYPHIYGSHENRGQYDSAFHPPVKDTTLNTNSLLPQLFYRSTTKSFWGWSQDNGFFSVGDMSKLNGGSTGQTLVKNSNTDGDYGWSTPAGSTNANVGTAYRLAIPFTNNIKTVSAVYPLSIDTISTTNVLVFNIDTTFSHSTGWNDLRYGSLSQQNTNTLNIATNTSNIATNTANISTNTSHIATNTSNIATNTSNIATNTSNIATNTSNINSNTTAIAGKEPSLGNPSVNGYVLSSTTGGVRSWVAQSGGGTSEVSQSYTGSSTVTISNTTTILYINPASLAASITITMPVTPTDMQRIEIHFGGTMTSGNVVTSLTISPNTGQTVLQASTPSSVAAGESISYRYNSSNSIWYRIN